MKTTLKILLATSMLLYVFIGCGGNRNPKSITVSSPDSAISATVSADGGESGDALTIKVSYNGHELVAESPLGIVFEDGTTFAKGLAGAGIAAGGTNTTYTMPYGKSAEMTDNHNEVTLALADKDGRRIDVVVRAFDDGIAYRYVGEERPCAIKGELSSFTFPSSAKYWGLHLNSFTTSYETDYTVGTLADISPSDIIALPILVNPGDGVWAAVTEADLTDYAGMYVKASGSVPGRLTAILAPHPDSTGVAVHVTRSIMTPWRVIMIADNPGRLIESNIVLNLNDPCEFDTSWIKPGRTAWDWWSGPTVKGQGFVGGMDNRTMKHYIDFASDYGLEYMLIDAGWYGNHATGDQDITASIPEINLPALVSYANERGVDIMLWINWRCAQRQMNEAFALYEKWGVKGVKVDYMNRDDQEMVNLYHRIVEKAAEHHLLVDFHGAYKPAGMRRTLPNLITREGVMGLEYVKWSDRATPEHDCIIPFTRMLAGPLDYTPGGFTNTAQGKFISRNLAPMTMGTRCHQLALYVIFESPLQMLVDYPGNYRGKTGIEFLRNVPVTWDDTRVLTGEPGNFVTIARKHGDAWYVGSITDWTPRTYSVPLDFLGEGSFTAEIFRDGPDAAENAESAAVDTIEVIAGDLLEIAMAPGGGQAVRIIPAK